MSHEFLISINFNMLYSWHNYFVRTCLDDTLDDTKANGIAENKEIGWVGKKRTVSKNSIEGLIIPNQWDDTGKTIGIAIHTNKEEVYLVAHNRMESELLNYLHLKVAVKGKIMERLDGNKLIHVSSFQTILEEFNDNPEKQQHGPLKEDY